MLVIIIVACVKIKYRTLTYACTLGVRVAENGGNMKKNIILVTSILALTSITGFSMKADAASNYQYKYVINQSNCSTSNTTSVSNSTSLNELYGSIASGNNTNVMVQSVSSEEAKAIINSMTATNNGTTIATTPSLNYPQATTSVVKTPVCETTVTQTPSSTSPVYNTPVTQSPVVKIPIDEAEVEQTNVDETNVSKSPADTSETTKPSTEDTKVPETTIDKTEVSTAAEDTSSISAYAKEVVTLVNEERAAYGLSPLTLSTDITNAAKVRALEIQSSFSHTRPDGRNFYTALTDKNINYKSAGENIAWGQKTPEEVVTAWMNSAGHRANILNENYTTIGVGYLQNQSGTNYWVQLFTNN